MSKLKIAILFVGQIRTNSLSLVNEETNPKSIIDSYDKYLFTEEWKTKIDHDVFITTDDMHLRNTFRYFGQDKIKNIHLLETGYVLHPIVTPIPDENHFMDIYYKNNFQELSAYPQNVHQFYKWYDVMHLLHNYTENIHQYDYIIKTRLDIEFTSNIMECIDLLQNDEKIQLIGESDIFGIGRPSIMQNAYMNLITKPLFDFRKTNYNFKNSLITYDKYMRQKQDTGHKGYFQWTYAPETQLYESLFEFCSENNIDIDNAIKHKQVCFILR